MLFWETIQCNKRFRSFIVDTERGHDFIVLILFYALEYRTDPTKQGVVRMCVFVLQTLSGEENFGTNLNKKFEGQDSLPPAIKIDNFDGTYADFLISVSFTTKWEGYKLTCQVNTYSYYRQQGQTGHYISCASRHNQEHCSLPREA